MFAGGGDAGRRLALRFLDKLAACFDPVVGGIAGNRKLVPALGNEVGADADFLVGRLECARL